MTDREHPARPSPELAAHLLLELDEEGARALERELLRDTLELNADAEDVPDEDVPDDPA